MSEPFRILTVCTGNICRSPAAEFLLRRELGAGVAVTSAGVAALVDEPVDPQMADRLRADGLGTEGFRARRLTPAMIEEADLVLAMTRAHRAEVVTAVPRALGRAFTLTEYATILDQWVECGRRRPFYTVRTPDRLAEFTAVAARLRGTVRFAAPEEYDIPDPFQAAPEVYDVAYGRIGAAVAAVAAELRGGEPTAGVPVRATPMPSFRPPASVPGTLVQRPAPTWQAPGGADLPAPQAETPWVPERDRRESGQRGLRGLFRRRRP